jgi:hypothetical protein
MQVAQSESLGLLFTMPNEKFSSHDGKNLCALSQYIWLPAEKDHLPIGLPGRLPSLNEQQPSLVSPAVHDRIMKVNIFLMLGVFCIHLGQSLVSC